MQDQEEICYETFHRQNQPSEVFCKISKWFKKTPVLDSLFNKDLQLY